MKLIKRLELPKIFNVNGYVATLTRARKAHRCREYDGMINAGDYYYALTIGGGGLGSTKFPRRVCVDCLGVE